MKIKKGRSRIVLIFPYLKIAIKIPLIHFILGIHTLFERFKEGLVRWEWNRDIESMESFKELLFKGIIYNWREYWFFIKSHHPFLMPTYFSFLGFLNIQRLGRPYLVDSSLLWRKLINLSSGVVAKDNHHFTNPDNFC